MRVVFDQKLLSGDYPNPVVLFMLDLVKRMAWLSRDDDFVFLLPPNKSTRESLPDNIYFVKTGDSLTRFFGSRFFQRMRLPKDVKQMHADVFVGIDNPLTWRYEQGTALLLLDPRLTKDNGKAWEKTFRQVKRVASFTDQKAPADKLVKFPPPFSAQEMRPTWGRKESIKVQYSYGHDYFLFAGDLDENHLLLDLLKAFSQFKQRQHSGMRLYLAGKDTNWTSTFENLVDSYKYRADVIIMRNPSDDDLKDLMAAAYAFVYPATRDCLPVNVLHAMAAGVPVIASDLPALKEWAGDAIITVSGPVPEGFARAMQGLYKDESSRDPLIGKADALQQHDPEDLPQNFLSFLKQASERK